MLNLEYCELLLKVIHAPASTDEERVNAHELLGIALKQQCAYMRDMIDTFGFDNKGGKQEMEPCPTATS